MAVERTVAVGWIDLRAIVFQCVECNASITLRPDVTEQVAKEIEDHCPAGHFWADGHTRVIAAVLRGLRSAMQEQPKFKVLLQFDAAEPRAT
jgi:hypothetical protein